MKNIEKIGLLIIALIVMSAFLSGGVFYGVPAIIITVSIAALGELIMVINRVSGNGIT